MFYVYCIVALLLVIIALSYNARQNEQYHKQEEARLTEVELHPDPEEFTVIGEQNPNAVPGSCEHLINENGDATSVELFECLNHDKQRFGVSPRLRTAFGPANRRVSYDQLTSTT